MLRDSRLPIKFLVNPAAGGGRTRRRLGRVRARVARLGAAVELSASGPDLTARAAAAVAAGARRLIVMGGDGSVHLAIQALAGGDCELAVIPAGRGDDFATSLGVSARLEAALELAIDGSAREIDLIRADLPGGRTVWGGVYVGLGLDSAITRTANAQSRRLPRRITYLLAAARNLVRYRAHRMTVSHEGGRLEETALLATACNAPRLGGGMRLAPEADMSDGRLELVIVRSASRARLLRLLPTVYSGGHVGAPEVSIVPARRLTIAVEPPAFVASDGELEGEVGAEPVEIAVQPAALRVVAP